MSEEKRDPDSGDLGAQVEAADRRLSEAIEAAKTAEERATAEIRALEADWERDRQKHAEELSREREAREQATAAAERRLSEIEAAAEAAEKRVEEAERRAAMAEGSNADVEARAREAAAAWLRGQIETIRREASR
jgi:chromosome segregation ATPase